MASPPPELHGFGVDRHHTTGRSRAAHRPISTRFEPASLLRGFNHWFTRVTPSDLACRTRTVWQYQHVPALSGLLPTLPGVPRIRLPPASPGRCDDPAGRSLTPLDQSRRLVAHSSAAKKADAAFKISFARRSSAFSRRSRFSSADSSLVDPGRAAGVDLGLADPLAQRLGRAAELLRDRVIAAQSES